MKTVLKIILLIAIFFAFSFWRYSVDCYPKYDPGAKVQIDPVLEKARMKSCMTFGIL